MSEARPDAARSEVSIAKRFLFTLLCLLLPLLVFAAAEGILRLTGWGGYSPFFKEFALRPDVTLVVTDKAGSSNYFFMNREKPGTNDEFAFLHPKPPNTLRLFLAGESAIKGFPQPIAFSAAAFLQADLQHLRPDRTIEVINLGTTAVASFPVLDIVRKALRYEPDLVVIGVGHNEFFGAYGVASANRASAHPLLLAAQYHAQSLALIQALSAIAQDPKAMEHKTLMEFMAAQPYVDPQSRLRQAAARNLYRHVAAMVDACRAENVPVMVCTLPTNERDLAPMGRDRLSTEAQEDVQDLLGRATAELKNDPRAAVPTLESLLLKAPEHARGHYLLGRALLRRSETERAHEEFIKARDLDTMPWRATSASQAAVALAARDHGALYCDAESAFRNNSPGGSIGWDLMDDHVHPSLRGQALLARTMTHAIASALDLLSASPEQLAALPGWETVAAELGDNPYDRYSVHATMEQLFGIPFMKESNPEGLERCRERTRRFERGLHPDLRAVCRTWRDDRTHVGGKRPLSAMAARALMRQGDFAEAQALFEPAKRSVPPYSSWYLEYAYFQLACAEKLHGHLNEAERQAAKETMERGRILLSFGDSTSGLTERYMGRLHQLLGEFAEAIPYLLAARPRLSGFDLVAADQALFLSYQETGDFEAARELARFGAEHSGPYARHYQQMLAALPAGRSPAQSSAREQE